ncbi:MAG: hypothetical protein C0606_07820 [Hyphomicrobiales bacterium]|nr:MAG: hypothetical protein C0606_07820 [Hyphomicrobiales bacterium]
MKLILSPEDLAALSPSARAEIIELLMIAAGDGPDANLEDLGEAFADFEMADVVALGADELALLMENVSEKYQKGLRVFAEQGPIIGAGALRKVGIDNVPHFQSRITIRTRTITGNPTAFLMSWDDWTEYDDGWGRYAMHPTTYESLKSFFGIEG